MEVIPAASVLHSAAGLLDCDVLATSRCAGGDLNQAWKLELDDGRSAFLKSRPGAPVEEFELEAAGLRWLAVPGALPVPEVLGVIESPQAGLLLEWIEPGGRLDARGEEALGRGLAEVHRSEADHFGQPPEGGPDRDLHVGPVDLGRCVDTNPAHGFGPCYASRIEGLIGQALASGSIDPDQAAVISGLCHRIDEFAGPVEPPSRTHGDLWSGNVLVDAKGDPWLVDPAAHGAHRELDLAMLSLFGAPSDRFFAAYKEVFPLEPEYRNRIDLWQIQPLLIHSILFGGTYGAAATRAAATYLR
ncbi:MAG: fructosamine kinase family protein [Actinomycetota bacterium]|nr:fructosamine kinase family protein [Actinomycetota bacterium]